MCVRERESVYVFERRESVWCGGERESVCVCVCVRERGVCERESVWKELCVCV